MDVAAAQRRHQTQQVAVEGIDLDALKQEVRNLGEPATRFMLDIGSGASALVLVGLAGPLLGAVADVRGSKKAFLGAFLASQGLPLEPRFHHRCIDTHSAAAALRDAGRLPRQAARTIQIVSAYPLRDP